MNPDYETERRGIWRRLLIILAVVTMLFAAGYAMGMRNNEKDMQGPINMNETAADTLKTYDFVEIQFDRLVPYFAELVNEESSIAIDRFYIIPYQNKDLLLRIAPDRMLQMEKIVNLSMNGKQSTGAAQVSLKGKLVEIPPDLKQIADEALVELAAAGTTGAAGQYWPYLFDPYIPAEIGQDNSGLLLQFLGGGYVLIVAVILLAVRGNFNRLKSKYGVA